MDPIIEVTVLGKKKYTTSKEKVTRLQKVNWSEHLFYEPKKLVEMDIFQKSVGSNGSGGRHYFDKNSSQRVFQRRYDSLL